MKNLPFLALSAAVAFAVALVTAAPASADYEMPPMDVVFKTVPVIVDATVTRVDPKTGAARLKIHREIRGGVGAETILVTKTSLTCTPSGPGTFGVASGKRYVFLLQAADTLYEETTYYEVVGDPDKADSLRILYPRTEKVGEPPSLTFGEFAKLIAPSAPKDPE